LTPIRKSLNGAGEMFWEVDERPHGKRKDFSSKDAAIAEAQIQRIRLRKEGLEGFEFTLDHRTDAKMAVAVPGRKRSFINAGAARLLSQQHDLLKALLLFLVGLLGLAGSLFFPVPLLERTGCLCRRELLAKLGWAVRFEVRRGPLG